LSDVTYLPIHCQAGASVINVQSTPRTAPDLCKNVPHTHYYLVATVTRIYSLRSRICVYIHTFFTVQRHWSGKNNFKKKIESAMNDVCQEKSFHVP